MNVAVAKRVTVREKLSQFGALGYLLVLGGLALVGPYGMLSWGEYISTLERRHQQIEMLEKQRDELQNRVARLDPNNADPDLVTELLRGNMNVAHPDEYVLEYKPEQ